MKASKNDYHYYNALHNVFSVDYHEINQYILGLYNRPKQFIEETGAPLDRFLREYTLPGAPRSSEMPTGDVLEFINQVGDFTCATTGLFDEHKAHVEQCALYMQKASQLKTIEKHGPASQVMPALTELTPELIAVHEGLKKIKEKADFMAERLEKLEARWAGMKEMIKR